MNVKEAAITRAVAMLAAAGAQFAVLLDDKKWGDLEVAKPKGTPRKRVNSFRSMGYTDHVRVMQVGDVVSYTLEDEGKAKAFAASLSAMMTHTFGRGSAVTNRDGCKVEALRVQ
jgi:hypothetical protein